MSIRLQVPVARVFVPLLKPARYKGAKGGRGSAKSHFFADKLVTRMISGETRAVCVREVQKSISKSVKQLIDDKIRSRGLSRLFRILETHIEVIAGRGKGGRVDFEGMQNHTADSIKSLEGYDIAWVEEAQSLSQHSLDLLRPTIRKPGSELWFSWNPENATDPIEALLCGESPPRDAVVVTANYMDNPWFPDVLRDEMEGDRARDPDKYAHVWLGQYKVNSEARVFRNWRVAEFETPPSAVLRFGADWGFSIDPTTLVRMFLGQALESRDGRVVPMVGPSGAGRTLYIDQEAYKIGCEIDETPALFAGDCPPGRDEKQQWENTHKHPGVPGALKWTITADSARPETVSYMKRKGFRIIPAIKGPGSLEDGIEFLRTFDIVVHPRCTHTIEELTLYSWKTDPLTGEILPVLADKDNHLIDAARYGLEALRRGGAKARAPMPEVKRRDYKGADRGEGSEWQAA